MPRVTRRRTVEAPIAAVWKLVSDPYALPRWWPRVSRVEDVDARGGRRSQWTKVLETQHGRGVRADYRCVSSAEPERCERVHAAHLERARWMTRIGYRDLLVCRSSH